VLPRVVGRQRTATIRFIGSPSPSSRLNCAAICVFRGGTESSLSPLSSSFVTVTISSASGAENEKPGYVRIHQKRWRRMANSSKIGEPCSQ